MLDELVRLTGHTVAELGTLALTDGVPPPKVNAPGDVLLWDRVRIERWLAAGMPANSCRSYRDEIRAEQKRGGE